jgi:hypothetical protein
LTPFFQAAIMTHEGAAAHKHHFFVSPEMFSTFKWFLNALFALVSTNKQTSMNDVNAFGSSIALLFCSRCFCRDNVFLFCSRSTIIYDNLIVALTRKHISVPHKAKTHVTKLKSFLFIRLN